MSGRAAALEARRYGVNFVFGPVLDAAIEPAAPMVATRALSADPDKIIRLGSAIIRGYQENGLHVSAKHYPGAGRAPVDNHIETAVLDCPLAVLENVELRIYREVIQNTGLRGIMSGHIMAPAIDPQRLATVSPAVIGMLDTMNFAGVLITDSLAMKGIKGHVCQETLLADAMAAGHHLLLCDYNRSPKEQFEAMLAAFRQGVITQKFVNIAVRRILHAKNLILQNTPPTDFSAADHQRWALATSRRAITSAGNLSAWLAQRQTGRTLFIIASDAASQKHATAEIGGDRTETALEALIRQRFPQQTLLTIPETPDPAAMEKALDLAVDHARVVFIAEASIHSYKGTADFSRPLLALISGLRRKVAVFVLLGNPYAARELPPLPCVLFAYAGGATAQAAVEALDGAFTPTGKLPV